MVIARLTPMIHLCRLNRPIGIWLLMLPCWWGVALCSSPFTKQFWQSLGLYLIGAVCLRSAGCIINDWADQSYDARVTRTLNRPLACQAVSKTQALGLFLMMMVVLGSAPSVQDGWESGLASVQDRAQVGRSIQVRCHLTLCAL